MVHIVKQANSAHHKKNTGSWSLAGWLFVADAVVGMMMIIALMSSGQQDGWSIG